MEKLANSSIKASSYLYDREESISLNTETSWIKELLEELESDQILSKEQPKVKGFLSMELSLTKKKDAVLRDFFILRGNVSAVYNSSCVRCLEVTPRNLDLDLNCCVLPSELERDEQFEDSETFLFENEEMDLYFYKKGILDLKEILHENIIMSVDPLPLHDENCKGLCMECGTNLNLSDCPHHSSVKK